MKTCFLFPGQGAQYPGMAKDLYDASAVVRRLFTVASDLTGKDLNRLLFEGSEDELRVTDNTQIAVTLVNCAASVMLREKGVNADGCAGFSLGEYAALWEAGVLREEELFPIVKLRGELMEKASRGADTKAGPSGMAAVIGLPYEEALGVLESLKDDNVYLANYSSPIQVVIAGTAAGLSKAQGLFEEAGAMKYVVLKVSGPFHSPLLKEARKGLEEALSAYTFRDPIKPVYANVTGKRIGSGNEARKLCVEQVVTTVRWVTEEGSILADGYERILETGPGNVLSGLWKSFNKDLRCKPAGTLPDIVKLLEP